MEVCRKYGSLCLYCVAFAFFFFLIYGLNLGIFLSSIFGHVLCVYYHQRYSDERV